VLFVVNAVAVFSLGVLRVLCGERDFAKGVQCKTSLQINV
jgi:hypothetical protein